MDLSDLRNITRAADQIEAAGEQLGKIPALLNSEAVRTVVFGALAVAAIAIFVIVYVRTGDLVAAAAAPGATLVAVGPAIERARSLVWSQDGHDAEVADVIAHVPSPGLLHQLGDLAGE